MKLINLTPHKITFMIDGNGIYPKDVIEIPSSGAVRISEVAVPIGEINGIPAVRKTFGKAEGLPEEQEGTIYIVSAIVRAAYPERKDLASPGDLIRDADGNVVGCKNLIVNW